MNEFAQSLKFWRVAAIVGPVVAVACVSLPHALDTLRIRQNTQEVTASFVSGLMEREDCVNKADEVRGQRALRGIAETGHVVRWSQLRKVCVMAVTYPHQTGAGKVEHIVDVIDLAYSRKLFSFATDGNIDPKQLLRFDRDLDLPGYGLSGSVGEPEDVEFALSPNCAGAQDACVASAAPLASTVAE